MSPKRYLDRDDYYAYFLADRGTEIDLTDEELTWVARVEGEFDEVQVFLDQKVNGSGTRE